VTRNKEQNIVYVACLSRLVKKLITVFKLRIMKKLIIFAVVFIASTAVFSQTKAGRIDDTKHPILYSCPVKTAVIKNELGKCPICGMDLNLSPKEQIKVQTVRSTSCPLFVDLRGKVNLSPKEEMKMKIVQLNNSASASEERSVAKY
jgi:Heavy metal binding domain